MTDTVTTAVLGLVATGYDAFGNITARSDVGFYVYDGVAGGPHAVSQAGDTAYSYDPNGNMTGATDALSGASLRSVAWSSFNKPTRIEAAGGAAASAFVYGPSRARVRQTIEAAGAVTETVTYIGESFEGRARPGAPDELVHFIRADGDTVAIFTKTDDGLPATDKTRWLHRDHIGSVALVTDEAGAVAEARSFAPWGAARNADWTEGSGPPLLVETPRGFTGHEHLDAVGLIHMNGRVYDPGIGRFMSPDPSDATDPRVGFNRYSYVRNNPLSLTDPSGFAFETGWDAFNVGLGVGSFAANVAAGNVFGAVVDAVGVAIDAGATAIPGMPAGAGWAINSLRATRLGGKLLGALPEAAKIADDVPVPAGAADEAAEAAAKAGDGAAGAAKQDSAPVHGRPQETTKKGIPTNHAAKSLKVAQEWAAQPEKYKSVHMNQKLSNITDGEINSGIQPDVTGLRHDGKVDCCEVLSPRQTADEMADKITTNVPADKRGETRMEE